MRLLLVQDQVFLPSLGGGNKANRMLLEALARRGHTCGVVSPALTTRGGPTQASEFASEMRARGIEPSPKADGLWTYRHRGVDVWTFDGARPDGAQAALEDALRDLDPDWIVVSDDRRHTLLDSALSARGDRVVLLLQTMMHLPFGPDAARPNVEQTRAMRRARAAIVISAHMQEYLRRHGAFDSRLLPPPVFGDGPFARLGRPDRGFVTLINPCVEKGLDIFLGLAQRFPKLRFAAVPTWGAEPWVLELLARAPNVEILAPCDDIDDILVKTRVLLAPSVWPETLGYVVIEAMLRGIPVMASRLGGLIEAKLGVDYLLPVRPALRKNGVFVSADQDLEPWSRALRELVEEPEVYERVARASHERAHEYLATISVSAYEALFEELSQAGQTSGREPA